MKELENMVASIRDELNRLYEADYTDEERDEMEENGEAYDLYSYFADAPGVEYTISGNMDFLGARIAVTLGGPSIYVDTQSSYVEGFWGRDYWKEWIPFEVCDEISEIFEERYDAARG